MKPTGAPSCFYRLQINKDFQFQDARNLLPYFKELNISHLYFSPVFESCQGSNHGYDVTDFTKISEERGGFSEFDNLINEIERMEIPLKIILDIVPNHMAASPHNPYWNDVLLNGPDSQYWSLFDIKVRKSEKIEIPILSAEEDNEMQISNNKDGYCLKYYKNEYPLNKESIKYIESHPDFDVKTIHEMQHYMLVPWTDAFHSVSYRRFFDVMGLIGLKIENEKIFHMVHKKLSEIMGQYSCIHGVRVDHIDGLADPKTYLSRLFELTPNIWIEKILARNETLPAEWKTLGTTGYEFIDHINQILVHPQNFQRIENFWIKVTQPEWNDFQSCVFQSKQKILKDLFQPEMERLITFISKATEENPLAETFWAGLISGLDIYRTYPGYDLKNNKRIDDACKSAEKFLGADFLDAKNTFLPRLIRPSTEEEMKAAHEWQQLSGPVMAKGLEDTAHYRYTPLTALNDVGCTPVIRDPDFRDYCTWLNKRHENWPQAVNATSTHDTKRSEDTRHRLYALADIPNEWMNFYTEVTSLNSSLRKELNIAAQAEYFLYQSLLGTWPLNETIDPEFINRIKDYMKKASREARIETEWTKPNNDYEKNLDLFIENILTNPLFINLTTRLAKRLARIGAINSLTVLALKILSPGIPDIYQGMEHWEFNLVDPDNRRAVDYKVREELLSKSKACEIESGRKFLLNQMATNWKDGTIKIWLTRALLNIRNQYLHESSLYVTPVNAKGQFSENIIAYTLTGDAMHRGLLVVAPRYPGLVPSASGLLSDWRDTEIYSDIWSNSGDHYDLLADQEIVLTGKISDLLAMFPIGVISFSH